MWWNFREKWIWLKYKWVNKDIISQECSSKKALRAFTSLKGKKKKAFNISIFRSVSCDEEMWKRLWEMEGNTNLPYVVLMVVIRCGEAKRFHRPSICQSLLLAWTNVGRGHLSKFKSLISADFWVLLWCNILANIPNYSFESTCREIIKSSPKVFIKLFDMYNCQRRLNSVHNMKPWSIVYT